MQAFEGFWGSESRSSAFLASFLDFFLRKGQRGLTEFEVEETLESLLTLFRYLRDKDIFEAYYKRVRVYGLRFRV